MRTIPLGEKTEYITTYTPDLLYPIARQIGRTEIGVGKELPFYGYDVWNGYELSWLNAKGKPEVAIGELIFPITSVNLIESKSLKLYLNSFNSSKFSSIEEVSKMIIKDLSASVQAEVGVKIIHINDYQEKLFNLSGICLDNNNITCDKYNINPNYLLVEEIETEEILYSHLLKSNCLVTGQPDFASVQISYQGNKINHQGLLKYIVSFRDHNEFHEQCIERIFVDIMRKCAPKQLTVYGRYTRRGGLDINPYRSTYQNYLAKNMRLYRQ